ncbi:unnamed protein product [Linum trigynum]|uniref:Uncharacterized protein n=1 Tax=Linum trigynum TaxID=586398 RepID=A0AAV2G6Q0_9ROSI
MSKIICWVYGSGLVAPGKHPGTASEGSGASIPPQPRPRPHPREDHARFEGRTHGRRPQTPNDDVSLKP